MSSDYQSFLWGTKDAVVETRRLKQFPVVDFEIINDVFVSRFWGLPRETRFFMNYVFGDFEITNLVIKTSPYSGEKIFEIMTQASNFNASAGLIYFEGDGGLMRDFERQAGFMDSVKGLESR